MILNSPTISGSLTVTGNIISSGSITLSGSIASASYADTASFVALAQSASNAVSAQTASFANAFTVASTLTAQTLVVQTITSSVDFVTGSTRFGSILGNTHQFTGSVSITGSLSGTSATFSGSVTSDDLILTAGTLFGTGNTGFSNRLSDTTLYLQMPASGFNITDNALNTKFILSPAGAATFYSSVTAATKLSVGTSSTLSGVDMWIHSNSSTNVNVARLALTTDATGHTASDGSWIHVESTGLYIDNYENDAIIFSTNTLERMRVTPNVSSATLGSGGALKIMGTGTVSAFTELQFYTYNAPTNQPPVSIGIIKTDNGGYENGEFYIATKATNANIAPTERVRVTSAGNVGIGDAGAASQRLRTVGASNTSDDYSLVCAKLNGTSTMLIRNDNYAYIAAASWAYGSDLRMKENISDVENGLDIVLKMKPKHFDYIDGQKDNLGFIAQDIQEIIPQAVSVSNEESGMLSLKTDFLVPYLTKAIQELKTQNDALQSRIETLESK
jgi:hypothetical protein